MPRPTEARSRRIAAAVLAAAVVGVAAAATSLASSAGWTTPSQPSTRSASPAEPAASAVTRSSSAVPAHVSGSAAAVSPAGSHSVLFVGRSASLNPRGGTARSFACRAATDLGWVCHVAGGKVAVPSSIVADVVVVALVPADDAASVTRLLDRLPPTAVSAATVLLGPVVVRRDSASTRRFAAVRRLAERRGAVVIDPVADRWVSGDTRTRYLTADGDLTAAGHEYAASRLATALRDAIEA